MIIARNLNELAHINIMIQRMCQGSLYFVEKASGIRQDWIPHAVDTWHRMINMKHLRLKMGVLTLLPKSLFTIRTLEFIDFGMNGLKYLPTEMGSLERLTHLDVSFNKLIDMPPTLGKAVSLVKLVLNNNLLSKLPVSFSGLTNLELLDVRRNDIKIVPPIYGVLTCISTLRLDDNPLVDFQISADLLKKGVVDVLWELRRLYNLQQLGPTPDVNIKGI